MAEQIGQYYFDVEKGEFKNKGKMIQLDARGSKRFSWQRYRVAFAVVTADMFTGGFAGVGITGKLLGIPLEQVAYTQMNNSESGIYAMGILLGMAITIFATLTLNERLKEGRINRSFIRS